MKKNIQLCLITYALTVGFGMELQASSGPFGNGSMLRQGRYANAGNGSSAFSGLTSDTNSVSSDESNDSEKKILDETQNIISRAFQSVDDWVMNSDDVKVEIASDYINKALDNLGDKIGGMTMQPIKDAATRAITFFSTETVVTKRGTISNKVLAGIVNGIKIAITAPVKFAIRAGIILPGLYAGATGGAIAGLGNGIHRTARSFSELSIMEGNKISMQKVAWLIPATIIKTLKGVVGTTILTAYGAAEGVLVGSRVGHDVTNKLVGSRLGLKRAQSIQTQNDAATQAEVDRIDESSPMSKNELQGSADTQSQMAEQQAPAEIDRGSLVTEKARVDNLSSSELQNEALTKLHDEGFFIKAYLQSDGSFKTKLSQGRVRIYSPQDQKDILLGSRSISEIHDAIDARYMTPDQFKAEGQRRAQLAGAANSIEVVQTEIAPSSKIDTTGQIVYVAENGNPILGNDLSKEMKQAEADMRSQQRAQQQHEQAARVSVENPAYRSLPNRSDQVKRDSSAKGEGF